LFPGFNRDHASTERLKGGEAAAYDEIQFLGRNPSLGITSAGVAGRPGKPRFSAISRDKGGGFSHKKKAAD
jgi:hypothetical protein